MKCLASKSDVILKTRLQFVQGHWKWHHLIDRIGIPIHLPHGAILYRLKDIATYWWKIAKFLYPTCIYHPRRGWHRHNFVKMFGADKTRMMGLPYGEKLWQYVKPFSSDTGMSRTDRHRQTDGHPMSDRQICYISVSRVRHNFQWPWTTRKGPFIAT